MTGGGVFFNANHLLVLREERPSGQKNWDDFNNGKLKVLVRDLYTTTRCFILPTKSTGSWLKVHVNMVTGTVLVAILFSYIFCARYDINPPPPPQPPDQMRRLW